MPAKLIDLTGKRYGRLTVIERVPNKGKKPCWKCRCDCGNVTVVFGYNLKNGTTRSCGCLHKENGSKTAKKCSGELSCHWKGSDAGYAALHDWVRKHFPASKVNHCCERCGRKAKLHLHNIDRTYSRDLANPRKGWVYLCPECHVEVHRLLNE